MSDKDKAQKIHSKKHVARLERERQQVTLVRTIAISMITIVVLLVGYGYLDTTYLQLQKPVVDVNGEKISITQWQERVQLQRVTLVNLYQRYQFFQQQFGMDTSKQLQEVQYYLSNPEVLGQSVIDQMTDEALIRQEAEKRGITVSESEIQDAVQAAYRFFPNGTPVPTITPTSFEYPTQTSGQLTMVPFTATPTKALTATPDPSIAPTATFTAAPPTPTFVPEAVTATATPYTIDGFQTEYQATVDQYKSYGISEATLRSAYTNDLLRKKLLDVITADQPTTEEQVWARHILINDASLAGTVSLILAQGGDFAKAAEKYSIDTGSAVNGGDLGWFGKGMMVPEFEQAAFSQKIGEIGKPVQSQFGYHIIQVIDRQELPLSANQLDQKRQTAFNDWISAAKEQAVITTYDTWKIHLPAMPDFASANQ